MSTPIHTIHSAQSTMDRSEEDMKSLGFFGIFKQSFKTIFKNTKIFSQITLTLLLPLTIIFIAHMEISHHLFSNINTNSLTEINSNYDDDKRQSNATDWLYYLLFKILYLTFLTIFSLLSTAAVVFTIASIYTDREIVFRNVMKIVPKIWKRLLVTFCFIYIAFFIYDVIGGIALAISRSIFGNSIFGLILTLIILFLYILGFLYLTVVWQLASVVTVLENSHGFKAMRKGKDLAYGKKKVGMGIAFVLYGFLVGVIFAYELFVGYGGENLGLAIVWRVMIGIVCGILLLMLFLLFIVVQTVFYLVCKSHHREVIDKLGLSTFLGAYMGETVVYPAAGEEIQLGRVQPQAQVQQV